MNARVELILTSLIVVFFIIIGNTLIGGITGWIVGLAFGNQILHVFRQVGVDGITMWQLGLALGFISGFYISHSNKKEYR